MSHLIGVVCAYGRLEFRRVPIGSIAVPFFGLPYTILNMKPQKGTTMEPIGSVMIAGSLGSCALPFMLKGAMQVL